MSENKLIKSLPGWVECSLSEVTTSASRIDPKLSPSRVIKYIDISSIDNVRNVIVSPKSMTLLEAPTRARQIVKVGDVLFSTVRPYLKNIASVPKNYDNEIASTGFAVLRPLSVINPSFLYYKCISSELINEVSGLQYGMSYPAVKEEQVLEQTLLLPPLKEQRRIVAKIEELFSELDKGIESLKNAQRQLKIYRQSLLKQAFEGKLTADWRQANQDKLETADQLLARIKAARKTRYQQQLEEWKADVEAWVAGGKKAKKPSKPKKLTALAGVIEEGIADLSDVPNEWSYVCAGMLFDVPKYGTSKKCDYDIDGAAVLRIPNVIDGEIDDRDLKYAQFDDDEIQTYSLKAGDLLVIRSNGSLAIVGKSALVSSKEEDYLYAGYLIRLRPNQAVLLPEYLKMVLSSHMVRQQIAEKAKSTSGVNNINSGELQSLIVPICSLDEQFILVQELGEKLSEITRTERELQEQLKRSEFLRQAILKKAFSGQLVPQDPADEPASALLERIKNEKAAVTKPKRQKRKKTS